MLSTARIALNIALFATVSTLLVGCSCSDDNGGGGLIDGGPSTGFDSGFPADGPIVVREGGITITEDGGTSWTCYEIICDGHGTDCGDCEDNDGDGLVDQRDPECLGPCDNTESAALLAGVGGETGGPCKSDCYFDFGNGSGNDKCEWDHRCDPLSVAPNYHPEGSTCEYNPASVGGMTCPDTQIDTCIDTCMPLTPNGCDCFGCCTFDDLAGRSAGDGGEWVWLGSVIDGTNTGTCTFEDIDDTSKCRPCTPVDGCLNNCGRCELCLGRDSIPEDCYTPPPPPDAGPYDAGPYDAGSYDGGPPEYRCAPGEQFCGLPGEADCPNLYYCITGCCKPTIF